MNEMLNCSVYQAGQPSAEDGYKDTQKILEKLSDKTITKITKIFF